MKKQHTMLSLFILLLYVKLTFAQPPQNDWQALGLKGKVKSLKELTGGEVTEVLRFNKQGILTERIDLLGILNTDVKYNVVGGKISVTRKGPSLTEIKKQGVVSTTYEYNRKGLLKGYILTYASNQKRRTYLKYDNRGNCIEQKTSGFQAEYALPGGKWVYTYNKNNQKTSEVYYNLKGKLRLEVVYTYSKSGKLALIQYVDADRVWTWQKSKFDKNGNIIEVSKYSKNGELSDHYRYEYDVEGNKIKKSKDYLRDEPACTYYDKKGNIIKFHSPANMFMASYTHTYTYDKYNNWIVKNESSAGEKYTREIEYYE